MIYNVLKKILPLLVLSLFIGCSSNEDAQNTSPDSEENAQAAADSTQRSPIAGYVEQAAFTSLDGDTVRVSDFKGKVVMIDLWETWCAPCIESFPTLQELQEDYSDDFIVLAVTPGFSDTRKDAKAFADEHDYSFRFLMDTNELYKKIKVQNIPYKLFIDAEGNFIKKSLGSYGPKQDYKKIKQIIEEHRM